MISTTLCYLLHEGKYLMLHRVKKEKDLNAGKWVGVGGKLEPGETADACVKREVFEETGLILTDYECLGLVKFVSDIYEDEDMYLYRGLAFEGQLREDCPEGVLQWIPVEEVPKLPIWEGDKYFLQAMLENRKNLNMVLRYEGERLVEVRDDTTEAEIDVSGLIRCPHGFSTRIGGVSEGIFNSLNLGRNRGDYPERVNENWRRFLEKCDITNRPVVCGKQIHGNDVLVVTQENDWQFCGGKNCADHWNVGNALVDANDPVSGYFPPEADGFVTNLPGVPLAVFTADCVPVLLEDARNGVIGAVHSGWRSTVADIEGVAVQKMLELGADVKEIHVAIGPAIDQCCFEVGPEVIDGVERLLGSTTANGGAGSSFYSHRGEKFMLDLRGVVKQRLIQLGIPEANIEKVGGCTMCHPKRYWSHRYTNGERGSQASVIMKLPFQNCVPSP